MKIGDRVKYIVGGKTMFAKIVWLKELTAIVDTDQGSRAEVDLDDITLI